MKILRVGVGATRLAPLMELLGFDLYVVIYALLIVVIFVNFLIFGSTLRINKITSKFYQSIVGLTRSSAVLLLTFLLIPIGEFFLLMLKCDSKDLINIFEDSITCWKSIHFLYAILGIAIAGLFFAHMGVVTVFYFDPFNNKKSSATKCDITAEGFLLGFKVVAVLRYVLIGNDWISILIMLFGSILYLRRAYDFPTYNHEVLSIVIAIRNATWVWTYFVLLISKIFATTQFNGQIFLLLVGYPIVILVALFYYNVKAGSLVLRESHFNDPNEYVQKMNYLKMLTEGFMNKNKSSKSNKTNSIRKDEISLKSYITVHEETCVDIDCPLKRFLDDAGNFSLQKSSLMNYMNQMYTEGIKKFPVSKTIMMHYVSFNYEKKINLNFAKTYLVKLEKMQNSLTEDFLLYIIRQNIFNTNATQQQSRSNTNEDEVLKIEESVDNKFKRLKSLIEAASKFYGEFWGALSTNLTNNLNLKKLFFVGNKLNKILTEINNLWEQDLKNRKIDPENHQSVQLYVLFLKDIMKNKKKSEEIAKKLGEEQQYENKKSEGDHLDLENIEIQLENQEMVVLTRASEKGEIIIIQCSNSVITLLGYSKQEALGQRVEVLMPNMFQKDHAEIIGARIKNMRSALSGQHKDAFKSAIEKKVVFVMPKMKTGYLTPANTRFAIYNDDDFSNSYIVKVKIEHKDTKSVYGFYILTRDDFCIEGMTSSCLHLSLTMDLVKKYAMNINYLLRNELFEEIDFSTKINDFEEEPKKVYWVYPDLLYPKGEMMDITTKTDVEREKMVHDSKREPFYLLTCKFKYKPDEILAYGFRLTPIEPKQAKQEEFKLNFNMKRAITYDFSRLNFTRTQLVNEKSEAAKLKEKLRHEANLLEQQKTLQANTVKKERRKRRKSLGSQNNEDDEEDQKALEDNILTKEKLAEYQARTSEDIKSFIMSLHFYGDQFAFYKRDTELKSPYEDHYNKQPLIKQTLDEFIKKWAARKANENKEGATKAENSQGGASASADLSANIDYMSDTSSSLNNIFNEKSVSNIRLFSFFMFFLLCAIISLEFVISLSIIKDVNDRFFYADKAFKILNSLLYTKFFIQEAVMAQSPSYINIGNYYQGNNSEFIIDQMKEMAYYRQVISDTYSFFSNATVSFSDEYITYNEGQSVYIRTLSNGVPSVIYNLFPVAISRIPTTIFYVSTVNDNYNQINMYNRNAYELMMNLLNDYLLVWREMTMILVRDVKAHTMSDSRLVIIFAISFVISIISIFGIRLLFNKFIDDREKPVDLFLTIKKQKFEELKFATENFLNKLLNKFFGNEENDEEVQTDTGIKISSDDIIIAKFKQKTEYKQSIRTSSEYFLIFLKISIFFLIFQGYMAFKFVYMNNGLVNLDHYSDVFNATQYSQADLVLSANVAK
jgi:hypothetical protein